MPDAPAPSPRVSVVMPALNEQGAIGRVLDDLPHWVHEAIVVDNGSTDRTAEVAAERGARVVHEPRRGYGAACLAGIAALDAPDIVAFCDADYSDHVDRLGELIEPIAQGRADLVIGSRVAGDAEPGSLNLPQRFGNRLANLLLRAIWGVDSTDLGPFRAIRYTSLRGLAMDDRDFGWTVQMQARAARLGLRHAEVPTPYRNRIGTSKISGTLRGLWGAGTKILYTIGVEALADRRHGRARRRDMVMLFTRIPRPGTTKTRMIPALGDAGAAVLQQRLTDHVLRQLRGLPVEVRHTGGTDAAARRAFAAAGRFADQGAGDLGQRLHAGFEAWFAAGRRRVAAVGADCPGLTASHVREAFRRLAACDVVLGPASDGGYYLVALKQPHRPLFEGIDWGTDRVLSQTLDAADRLGLAVSLLPEQADIDRPEDLAIAERHGLVDRGE